LYITLPCQTVSAYRRRPVDQLVADALGGSSRQRDSHAYANSRPLGESALNDLPKETRLRRRRAHECFALILSGQYKPLGAATGVPRGSRIAYTGARRAARDSRTTLWSRAPMHSLATAGMLASDGALLRVFWKDSSLLSALDFR
jgi:hypothetical protein